VNPAALHPVVHGGAADSGQGNGGMQWQELGLLLTVITKLSGGQQRTCEGHAAPPKTFGNTGPN
jgi:hypothetical protein